MGLLAQLSNPPDVSDCLRARSKREDSTRERQRQIRLNESEIARLVERYAEGASLRQLESEFGVHRDTAARHLENNGVARRAAKPKLTDAQVRSAILRNAEGESLRSIATSLDVGLTTLRNTLSRCSSRTEAGTSHRERRNSEEPCFPHK